MRWLTVMIALFVTVMVVDSGVAQTVVRRAPVYDRLDAGQEAYARHEERRRYSVDRQRWLNDEMIFRSRSFPGWMYFAESWPFLPGDIYGYPLAEPPINQPVDQIEEQVRPPTWFSRPVYEDEFAEPLEAMDEIPADAPSRQPRYSGPREF